MAKAAQTPIDNSPEPTPMDYVGRLKANLNELVLHYEKKVVGEDGKPITKETVAKGAGLSAQTLDNLRDPKKTNSSVRHLIQAFVNLGRAPGTMFLTLEEFRASLVNDPPSPPLTLENPLASLVSSSSGPMQSVVPKLGGNAEVRKPARSRRSGTGDASIRCFRHTSVAAGQRAWTLPSLPGTVPSTTVPRTRGPACTKAQRVRETLIPSRAA